MKNLARLAGKRIRLIVVMGMVAALGSALVEWDVRAWAFEGDKHHHGLGASEIWNPESEGFLWFWIPVIALAIGILVALAVFKPWRKDHHTREQGSG